MGSPKLMAEDLEGKPNLLRPTWDRFHGYGVMGLPFASGHLLAFRRMTASSIGPPFTAVWHRDPSGWWTMLVDTDPERSCARFFGRGMGRVMMVEEIELSWGGPRWLSLRVPEFGLQLGIRLSSDTITRALNWLGSILPGAVWRSSWGRSTMGRVGGQALGAGHLSLSGRAPNGQSYFALPKVVFRIGAAAAVVRGEDLGPMGPLQKQASVGDFWIPNQGVFAIGEAGFESIEPDDWDPSPAMSGEDRLFRIQG